MCESQSPNLSVSPPFHPVTIMFNFYNKGMLSFIKQMIFILYFINVMYHIYSRICWTILAWEAFHTFLGGLETSFWMDIATSM